MVETPAEYPWSSYSAFIGKPKALKSLETNRLLTDFGKNKKEARKNYKKFVEGVDFKTLEDPGKHVTGGFILGDADFVNWIKDTFLAFKRDEKEIPQLKKLKPKLSQKIILQAVCQEFSCSNEQVITKGRKKNKAREVAIYLARDLSGLSCKDLGLYFGGVSGALITIMYNRIEEETKQNRHLKHRIERVKKRIFNI